MASLSPLEEKIAKLEAQVDSLLTLALTAHERFVFLRPMMADQRLNKQIESEGRIVGFERLRNWLYWAFVQELIKICSDNDPRTPCVANLRKQLCDVQTLSALEDKYAVNELEVASEAQLRAEFRRIYKGFDERAEEMLSSPTVAGYKAIRDKLISHNELLKSESGYSPFDVRRTQLKYGDERQLLETVRALVDDLMTLIRRTDFTWQRALDRAGEITNQFWNIEEKKP